MRKLIIFLALAASVGVAGAQSIYKYATPEGNVVYTDNPAAGLNGAKKLEMPTMIAASASSRLYDAQGVSPTPQDPATEGYSAARSEYREAKRRRVEGVAPLPDERDGRYFKPGYWARQRALSRGMMLAQKRLSQARSVAQAQAPVQPELPAQAGTIAAAAHASAVALN
jgi:hypothetical protein